MASRHNLLYYFRITYNTLHTHSLSKFNSHTAALASTELISFHKTDLFCLQRATRAGMRWCTKDIAVDCALLRSLFPAVIAIYLKVSSFQSQRRHFN